MIALDNAISQAAAALCLQLEQPLQRANLLYPRQLQQELEHSGTPDLAAWLAAQQQFPKFYWHSRDNDTQIAALGTALSYHNQQASEQLAAGIHNQTGLRYYWLCGFDSLVNSDTLNAKDPDRQSRYPQQLLFLPEITLVLDRHRLSLSVTLGAASDLGGLAQQLRGLRPCRPIRTQRLPVSQRQDSPNLEQWRQAVTQAKYSFQRGYLQKVVLARQSRFRCQPEVSFWALFNRWRHASVNTYQIGYQLDASSGFMSFTPERLLLREGLQLSTEAVAATLPRSTDSLETQELTQALLKDSKSRYEHDLVVVEIGAKLEGLGVRISHDEGTQLLQLAGLQHLQQFIHGQLPSATMDAQLLATLHPTAAVGGLPADNARRFILQHEPLARGLYAGCCGYFSAERSELAVTIRSALLELSQLTLYAGAGIVPQSDPSLEWQELEQKIALPLSLLDLSYSPRSSSEPQELHAAQPSRQR